MGRRLWMTLGLMGIAAIGIGGALTLTPLREAVAPVPDEVRVCNTLAELCPLSSEDADRCVDDVGQWMTDKPEATVELPTCVTDATTCAEAKGCLVGAGLRTLGKDVEGFLKGAGRALGLGSR